MNTKTQFFLVVVLSSFLPFLSGAETPPGASPISGGDTLLKAGTPQEYAAAFSDVTGDWKATASGFEGHSPCFKDVPGTQIGGVINDAHTYYNIHGVNLWRYAFAGKTDWQNYTFETGVRILDPAPLDGIRPGQNDVFINYQWGREAIGSDVGIAVRYQGPDRYYLVRLSTADKDIELWKTKGGVVCVKPFPFEANKDYRVAVGAKGPWITVSVDGAEVMRYADPVDPILSGKVGVAVRESRVGFSNAVVTPLAGAPDPIPPHKADFHFRQWVGRNYIFDGDEPVAHLDPKDGLQEMKMVPGVMPMILNGTVPTWGCLDWKDDASIKVKSEGETLSFSVQKDDKQGRCKGYGDWVLSYDPKVGYVWDLKGRVEVLVDGKIQKWNLDIADPCFYQTVAPATNKLPQCRTAPNYSIYTRTDGRYGYYPANHQFKNNNFAKPSELMIRKGGFLGTTVDDWLLVMELPEDNADSYWGDYCTWGLDQHVAPVTDPTNTNKFDMAAKGDVYHGHVRFHALAPDQVQQILKVAVLPDDKPENHDEMFAHVEPVNDFSETVPRVAGDSKVRWTGAYTIDRTVGHNDHISMRIDAADATKKGMPNLEAIGPSFRTGPYLAPEYRIGFWVKADKFNGTVALKMSNVIFFQPSQPSPLPEATQHISGACDWTHVSCVTGIPHCAHFWKLAIDVQGTGQVWVDDFEISPIFPGKEGLVKSASN